MSHHLWTSILSVTVDRQNSTILAVSVLTVASLMFLFCFLFRKDYNTYMSTKKEKLDCYYK